MTSETMRKLEAWLASKSITFRSIEHVGLDILAYDYPVVRLHFLDGDGIMRAHDIEEDYFLWFLDHLTEKRD